MIGRCKTCKWWKDTELFLLLEPTGYKVCCHPCVGNNNRTIPDPTKPLPLYDVVFASWGSFIGMISGPEFGCVHYSKRPRKQSMSVK